jgi:hypothetical protein
VAAATLLASLCVAAPAAAAGTPSKAAHPAKASVTIYLPDTFFVGGQPVTVPGRGFTVGAVVRPYVPGQIVTLRLTVGRRQITKGQLRLKPSSKHTYGTFTVSLSSPAAGPVDVDISHQPTTTLAAFDVHRGLTVFNPAAGFGATGQFVQLIQQRLAALHFYIPQTGVYDQGTGLALDAYHRLLGWGTSQSLDGRTVSYLLNGFGAFKVQDPRDGKHVEGDLSDQVLALIDGSDVQAIYPISSGKPSTPTVLGHFQVYSKVPGFLPDGMYFSNFFYGGYAIHGYDPAPDYPASHGCMRVPIPDAISIYDWLGIGDVVDVYYT